MERGGEWEDILSGIMPRHQYVALNRSTYNSADPRSTISKTITTKEVLNYINEVRNLPKYRAFVFYYDIEDPSSNLHTVVRTTHSNEMWWIDPYTDDDVHYSRKEYPGLIPWNDHRYKYEFFGRAYADPIAEMEIRLKRIAGLEDLNPHLYKLLSWELEEDTAKIIRKYSQAEDGICFAIFSAMESAYPIRVLESYL